MITTEQETLFQTDLQFSEKIIWMDQPNWGFTFNKAKKGQFFISIFWLLIALFWEGGVTLFGAPDLFRWVGDAFIAFGLYLLIGRYIWEMIQERYIVYILTNQRFIIRTGIVFKTKQTYDLTQLSNISYKANPNGEGTIFINSRLKSINNLYLNSILNEFGDIQVLRVDDVTMVYDKLLNAIKKANAEHRT